MDAQSLSMMRQIGITNCGVKIILRSCMSSYFCSCQNKCLKQGCRFLIVHPLCEPATDCSLHSFILQKTIFTSMPLLPPIQQLRPPTLRTNRISYLWYTRMHLSLCLPSMVALPRDRHNHPISLLPFLHCNRLRRLNHCQMVRNRSRSFPLKQSIKKLNQL